MWANVPFSLKKILSEEYCLALTVNAFLLFWQCLVALGWGMHFALELQDTGSHLLINSRVKGKLLICS